MSISGRNHQVAVIKEKNKENALMVYSKTYVRPFLRWCLLKVSPSLISIPNTCNESPVLCYYSPLRASSALTAQR